MALDAAGTFTIAGKPVRRLGFGAMRITGPGVWGWPASREDAHAVLRRAVELGVTFIDTADSYGPEVSEILIADALAPYAEDLVVATKAGLTRQGPDQWAPVGRPEYLRQQCELSLRRLGVDAIDLFQLHRIDPAVPADEQFGCLAALLAEGKVRAVGLQRSPSTSCAPPSASSPSRPSRTSTTSPTVAVSLCSRHAQPKGSGSSRGSPSPLARSQTPSSAVASVAEETGATPAQVSLAWLLQASPVVLPIPGTSSVGHLEENCAAADLVLAADHVAALDALAPA